MFRKPILSLSVTYLILFISFGTAVAGDCNDVLRKELLESYVSSSDYFRKSLGLALASELSIDDLGANFASEGMALLPNGIPAKEKLNASFWRARMKQARSLTFNEDIERKKEYLAYTSGSKTLIDAWLMCKQGGKGAVTFIETSVVNDRRLRFQWHGEIHIDRVKVLDADLSNASWKSRSQREMFVNKFVEKGPGQEIRAKLIHTDVCHPIEVDISFQKYNGETPIGNVAYATAYHPALPNCGNPFPDPPIYAVVSSSSNPRYNPGPFIIYPTNSVFIVDGRNGKDRNHYFKCSIDENWMLHAEFQHHAGGVDRKGPASATVKASDTLQPVHWGECKIECLASKHTPGQNPCQTDAVVKDWSTIQN